MGIIGRYCFYGMLMAARVAAAQYFLTPVVTQDSAVPDFPADGVWRQDPFDTPVLNANGQVAFVGTLSGSPYRSAVFLFSNGVGRAVARYGDQPAGLSAEETLGRLNSPLLLENGNLAFQSETLRDRAVSVPRAWWLATQTGIVLLARGGPNSVSVPSVEGDLRLELSTLAVNRVGDFALAGTVESVRSNTLVLAATTFLGRPGSLVRVNRPFETAPGTTNTFEGFAYDTALVTADGHTTLTGYLSGGGTGIWLATAAGLEKIFSSGDSVRFLGENYLLSQIGVENLNGRGDLLLRATVEGPGVSITNNSILFAREKGGDRMVAREGMDAPGLTNAWLGLPAGVINENGRIAVRAPILGPGLPGTNNWGVWLERMGRLELAVHAKGAVPGAPTGVVFSSLLPGPFMNRLGQVLFRATVTGLGITSSNNVGIWVIEPDLRVNRVLQTGSMMSIGGRLQPVTSADFGMFNPPSSGGDDGRVRVFNDSAQIVVRIRYGTSTVKSAGIFLASPARIHSIDRSGADVVVQFPTAPGRIFQLEVNDNLNPGGWRMAGDPVVGNGAVGTLKWRADGRAGFFRLQARD